MIVAMDVCRRVNYRMTQANNICLMWNDASFEMYERLGYGGKLIQDYIWWTARPGAGLALCRPLRVLVDLLLYPVVWCGKWCTMYM